MADFNIGRRIVEYALHNQDLQPFLDAGLDREWIQARDAFSFASVFAQETDVQAYLLIVRHYEKHGVVPTLEIFARNFPAYQPENCEYEASELIAEAHAAIKASIVAEFLDEFSDLDREGNYDAALEKILGAGENLNIPVTSWESEIAIQNEMRRLRISREARMRVEAESRPRQPLQLLTGPQIHQLDVAQEWRIDSLMGVGSNVLLNAQAKAGKSTMVINLVRSLLGGDDFLGEFRTRKVPRVTVIDLEMPIASSRRWLIESGMTQFGNLQYAFLSGHANDFEVTNDRIRKLLADSLKGVDVLIIDPLGPLLAALGLDENANSDVRQLLGSLTSLKAACGASELVTVHHQGHAGQRARGASVFSDWPDSIWTLRNTAPDDQNGIRKFTALGRDVWYTAELSYDAPNRALLTAGSKWKARETEQDSSSRGSTSSRILELLGTGRRTRNQLIQELGGRRQDVLAAVKTLMSQGKIRIVHDGRAGFVELIS